MQELQFHDTTLAITDLHGQAWLRGPQIAGALGYANPGKRIADLFNRHRAEFTPEMTALVDLPTPGGMQETRIFSLRGARLLAMHARTPRAAEFRAWVLDLIEGKANLPVPAPEADRVERLTTALLKMQPRLKRIAELRNLGLSRVEIAGAMRIALSTLHGDLKLLELAGLIAPPKGRTRAIAHA